MSPVSIFAMPYGRSRGVFRRSFARVYATCTRGTASLCLAPLQWGQTTDSPRIWPRCGSTGRRRRDRARGAAALGRRRLPSSGRSRSRRGVWLRRASRRSIFKTEVSLTEVALVSPAQAQVQLTSTGYVVPQVQVDLSSKLVGRVAKANVTRGERGQGRARSSSSSTRATSASRSRARRRAWPRRRRVRRRRAPSSPRSSCSATARSASPTRAPSPQATADDLAARAKSLEEQVHAADADVDGVAGRGERARHEPREHDHPRAHRRHGRHQAARCPATWCLPATSMAKIADFASIVVETDVPEGRLHLVPRGGPCEIVLDAYPDKRWRGEVVEVSPAAQSRQGVGDREGALPRPRRHGAARRWRRACRSSTRRSTRRS